MKHWLATMAVLLCCLTASAEKVEIDGIWYNLVSKVNQAEVTFEGNSYNSYSNEYSGSITLPTTVIYDDVAYSVTSIGNGAFRGCSSLISITIPEGVTSIGYWAFYGCSSLTSITLPEGVTSIGDYTFRDCSSLTSITLPEDVTSIGDYAFRDCSSLTSITIPASVTIIGSGVFAYCSSLTAITLPEGSKLTSIGNYAFYNCRSLTDMTIPEDVTGIGSYAFEDCSSLTTIVLPKNVRSIGGEAFAGCPELTDVYCNAETVPSTKTNAFDGSYPDYATLHVPVSAIESYKTTAPWSSFGKIIANTTIIDYPFELTTDASNPILYFIYTGRDGGGGADLKYVFANEIPWGDTLHKLQIVRKDPRIFLNQLWYFMEAEGGLMIISAEDNRMVTVPNTADAPKCTFMQTVEERTNEFYLWTLDLTDGCYAFKTSDGKSFLSHNGNWTIAGPQMGLSNADGSKDEGSRVFFEALDAPTSVDITINQYGSGTYCSPYALDFSNVEGLKAYAATGYNELTGVVTLTRVMTAKAGVGLFIKGEPGEYMVPIMENSVDNTLNMLVGILEAEWINITTERIKNADFTADAGWVHSATGAYAHNSGSRVADFYSGWGSLEHTAGSLMQEVTLPAGEYRLTGKAFFRQNVAAMANPEKSLGYMVAGDNKVLVKTLGSVEGLTAYANSVAEASDAFYTQGLYDNVLEFTLAEETTLNIGFECTFDEFRSWFVVGEVKIEKASGTSSKTLVNAYSADGLYANYKYTIKEGNSQPLFYQFADGSTLSAGKAYLQIPTAWLPAEAKSISLRFEEGEGTTDIENSQFTIDNSQLTYDLFGRRVDNPVKGGIYIVNGKKVIY